MDTYNLENIVIDLINNTKYFNSKHFSINDEKFVIGFSAARGCLKSELQLWSNNGSTTVISISDVSISNASDAVSTISSAIDKHFAGYVRCSDCGKWIKKSEVAGGYFAGSYCIDCWENTWKEVAANETYE